jgi:hypothetical protein
MNDPASGISIYGHLGRMQPDRRIWEGLSLMFLPDGGMLVNRSLGVSVAEARNAEYFYEPVVPTRTWRLTFEGVAQRVDPHALRKRPVGDEPFEAASYDLVLKLRPVFSMHGPASIRADAPGAWRPHRCGQRWRTSLRIGARAIAILSEPTHLRRSTPGRGELCLSERQDFRHPGVSRSGQQLLEARCISAAGCSAQGQSPSRVEGLHGRSAFRHHHGQ